MTAQGNYTRHNEIVSLLAKYSSPKLTEEQMFVKKEEYSLLAEGYYTVKALKKLEEKTNVDLPICNAVYDILYLNKDPKETLNQLFKRSLKEEF